MADTVFDPFTVGRVLDGIERDIVRLHMIVERHTDQLGHTGEAEYRAGVQRQLADLKARLGRLELGVSGTLVGVVLLLMRSFLP